MSEAFIFSALAETDSQRILIEASAGTGKTYTLERIVLYYLLAPKLRFKLDEILVVTFTRKATREIRSRLRILIKSCLNDENSARKLFEELSLGSHGSASNAGWRQHLARELRLFARAPVYTIHGFCQSVMGKYPLEAGTMFGAKLDQSVSAEACTDLIRRTLANGTLEPAPGDPRGTEPIDGSLLSLVLEAAKRIFGKTDSFELFETLAGHIESGLFDAGNYLYPAPGKFGVAELWRKLALDHAQDLAALLAGIEIAAENRERIAAMFSDAEPDAMASTEDSAPTGRLESLIERCAAFEFLRRLASHYDSYKAGHSRHQSRLSYDDLVRTVATSLRNHETFAERLRQDYRAVLIDEFQDTDGAQWDIFSRITKDRLVAVGDPKQAIYGFRGADLNTYLRARASFDRRFVLETNFRSSSALIGGLNALFDGLFTRGSVLGSQSIDFAPVRAGNVSPELWRISAADGNVLESLHFTELAAESSAAIGKARRALIEALCERVAELGNGSYRIQQPRNGEKPETRPLIWSDQAVLVQSNADARAVSERLASLGIPSTLLGQARLMESLEAEEIAVFLSAVERPWDGSAVHQALLTRIFGYSVEALDAAMRDGSIAAQTERFFAWHRAYSYKGLHRIFAEAVASVLRDLATREGSRFLRTHTNYNHIVDIAAAQFAAAEVPAARLSEAFASLRFTRFREEEPPLRIDRDSAAVRIMTMHSSKGLEFPVVHLLGGLVARGPKTRGQRPFNVVSVEHEGSVYRSFDPYMSESGQEAEAGLLWDEWLRLFYVAATRAQAMLCIPWLSTGGRTVQDTNLFGLYETKSIDPEALRARLGVICRLERSSGDSGNMVEGAASGLRKTAAPSAALSANPQSRQAALGLQRQLPQTTRKGWSHVLYPPTERQSSFTSLISAIHASDQIRVLAEPGFEFNANQSRHDESQIAEDQVRSLPEPAGADFGTLFHLAMEHIDFAAKDIDRELARLLAEVVAPRSPGMRFGQNYPNFASIRTLFGAMVRAAVLMRLPDGATLAEVTPRDMYRELVFNARVPASVQFSSLAELEGVGVFKLNAGFITGSIDMSYRAAGRWHIIDWKTNLVPEGRDIGFVMDENGYKLQALIYQSALHQSLCAQNGVNWNPETGEGISRAREIFTQDIGKVWYVFVRQLPQAISERSERTDTPGIFDATPGWERVLEFQQTGGLYSRA